MSTTDPAHPAYPVLLTVTYPGRAEPLQLEVRREPPPRVLLPNDHYQQWAENQRSASTVDDDIAALRPRVLPTGHCLQEYHDRDRDENPECHGQAVQPPTEHKEQSHVPLGRQASQSLNRSLMAAGMVDRIELTIFPVISGRTGTSPVLANAGDFDLELLGSRTFDGRSQLMVFRPTAHG
jgi:RibD C-terminal domain